MKRKRIILTASGAFLVVMMAAWIVLRRSDPPGVPLPAPNGHDDFVAAGQSISGAASSTKSDPKRLRSRVEQNAAALQLARRGLTKESRCPVEYSETYVEQVVLPNLGRIREVARAFADEGVLAQLEGRTNAAAQSYLDGLRFAHESARGGLMIERLVGLACQAIAMQRMERVIESLEAVELNAVLTQWNEIAARREPVETLLESEYAWRRHTGSSLKSLWTRLVYSRMFRDPEAKFLLRARRLQAEADLDRLGAAIRLHRLDQGKLPTRLEELVPRYLPSVPIDPFSGRPMIYRIETNTFVLYSLGPDKRDDGGEPMGPATEENGDLTFRPPPTP